MKINITHIDTPMHGVGPGRDRSYFPYAGYFQWTRREYFWRGRKIWERRIDYREVSPYDLVHKVFS